MKHIQRAAEDSHAQPGMGPPRAGCCSAKKPTARWSTTSSARASASGTAASSPARTTASPAASPGFHPTLLRSLTLRPHPATHVGGEGHHGLVTHRSLSEPPNTPRRSHLTALLEAISPWDAQERTHLAEAKAWIADGAPLYRIRKPDHPPQHLVSYFVAFDQPHGELLLVAHRKAGLWLPSGGHVAPGEDPWDTVVRECREELHTDAVPSAVSGRRPFFLTVTGTRGPGSHIDVSLWYLLQTDAAAVTSFDEGEFTAVRWLTLPKILAEPLDNLDPHMHRFTRKLQAAVG